MQVNDGQRQKLESLPTEDRFRLRGTDVTRLETLIDAAFAFVLTLLVISFDKLPTSYADMLDALKRVPAFVASFAMVMWFWIRHRRWSQRYGLENSKTILLSVGLMLVVMIYVYPLRMTFESFFSAISGGFLPSDFKIESADDIRGILTFYSIGFLALSLIFHQLYHATIRSADQLSLSEIEVRMTRVNMQVWMIVAGFATLSALLALILPAGWVPLAGYMYFLLAPVMSVPGMLDRKRRGRE